MPKFLTLIFCTMLVLIVGSNIALAQSAANPKSPSQAEVKVQSEIARYMDRVSNLKVELEDVEQFRRITEEKLKDIEVTEGKSGVSIESFPEIVKNLQAKRIDLMIDLAGLEAKQEAIQNASETKSQNEAMVAPLEELLVLKQARLEEIRKSGSSNDELRKAEMDFLASKVQLAQVRAPKASSQLLTDSLLTTSLALAESRARLSKTESLLAEVLPSRNKLEHIRTLRNTWNKFTEEEAELNNRLSATQREIERLNNKLEQVKKDEYLP